MRSLNSLLAERVLPSFAENALRPSSAVRASKLSVRKPDQVGDRLRLEDDRIDARLDRLRRRATRAASTACGRRCARVEAARDRNGRRRSSRSRCRRRCARSRSGRPRSIGSSGGCRWRWPSRVGGGRGACGSRRPMTLAVAARARARLERAPCARAATSTSAVASAKPRVAPGSRADRASARTRDAPARDARRSAPPRSASCFSAAALGIVAGRRHRGACRPRPSP